MQGGSFAGDSFTAPARRLEMLADAQRSALLDVRPSIVGQSATELQGPFAQDIESTDYTVYAVRRWRAAAGPWDVRGAKLRCLVGTGVALADVEVVPDLPPRGIAWHVQAQTVRVLVPLFPGFVVAEGAEDSILVWIARGRPFESLQPTSPVVNGATMTVPLFARSVRFEAASAGIVFPVPPFVDSIVEWLDPALNPCGSSLLAAADAYEGRSFIVPPLAAFYRIGQAAPLPQLGLVAQWSVLS
jgi:hypothetical protein